MKIKKIIKQFYYNIMFKNYFSYYIKFYFAWGSILDFFLVFITYSNIIFNKNLFEPNIFFKWFNYSNLIGNYIYFQFGEELVDDIFLQIFLLFCLLYIINYFKNLRLVSKNLYYIKNRNIIPIYGKYFNIFSYSYLFIGFQIITYKVICKLLVLDFSKNFDIILLVEIIIIFFFFNFIQIINIFMMSVIKFNNSFFFSSPKNYNWFFIYLEKLYNLIIFIWAFNKINIIYCEIIYIILLITYFYIFTKKLFFIDFKANLIFLNIYLIKLIMRIIIFYITYYIYEDYKFRNFISFTIVLLWIFKFNYNIILNFLFKKIDKNNKEINSKLFRLNVMVSLLTNNDYKNNINKENFKNNFKNELIVNLYGIYRDHINVCWLIDCFCKKKLLLTDPSTNSYIEYNKTEINFSLIYYKNLISQLFYNLSLENKNNFLILFNFSFYWFNNLMIMQRSIVILIQLKLYKLDILDNIYLDFWIWKVKRKLWEYDRNLNKSKNISNIDIFKIVEMENNYKSWYLNIKNYSLNFYKLIESLGKNIICCNNARSILEKIEKNLSNINNIYLKSIDIPRIMILYKIFIDGWGFWIEKKKINKILENLLEKVKLCKKENDQSKIELMYDENSAILKMAADIDNLGKIININKGVEKISGYKVEELENFKINKIIPNIISINHQSYLDNATKTGLFRIIYQERKWFLLNKNKYIIPITLWVKPMFYIKNLSFIYISYLQKIESLDNYILTDRFGRIDSYTENINYILTDFKKLKNCYIQYLSNELFDLFIFILINNIECNNIQKIFDNKKIFENLEFTVNHNYKIQFLNYNNISNWTFDEFIDNESYNILTNKKEFDNFLYLNKNEFLQDMKKKLINKKQNLIVNILNENDYIIEFLIEPLITLKDFYFIFNFKKINLNNQFQQDKTNVYQKFLKHDKYFSINLDKNIKNICNIRNYSYKESSSNDEINLIKNNEFNNKFYKNSKNLDVINLNNLIDDKIHNEYKNIFDNEIDNKNIEEKSNEIINKLKSTSSLSNTNKNSINNNNIYSSIIFDYVPKNYIKIKFIKYIIFIILILFCLSFLILLFFIYKNFKDQIKFEKIISNLNYNSFLCINSYSTINLFNRVNKHTNKIDILRNFIKDKNNENKKLLEELNNYNLNNNNNKLLLDYFNEYRKYKNYLNKDYVLNIIGKYIILITEFDYYLNNKTDLYDSIFIKQNINSFYESGLNLNNININESIEYWRIISYVLFVLFFIVWIILIIIKLYYIFRYYRLINENFEFITKFSKINLLKLLKIISKFIKYKVRIDTPINNNLKEYNNKIIVSKINKLNIKYKDSILFHLFIIILFWIYFTLILQNFNIYNKNKEYYWNRFFKNIELGNIYNINNFYNILNNNNKIDIIKYTENEIEKFKNLNILRLNNYLNKNILDSWKSNLCNTSDKNYFLENCLLIEETLARKGYNNIINKQIELYKYIISFKNWDEINRMLFFIDINYYNLFLSNLIKNNLIEYLIELLYTNFLNMIIIIPIFLILTSIYYILYNKYILNKLKKELLLIRKSYRIFPIYLFKENIKLMSFLNWTKNKKN